jgi:hypothetical protein
MDVHVLLADFQSRGIRLIPDGEELSVREPRSDPGDLGPGE